MNKQAIMGDPFIRTYIDDVLKTIQTQVLIKLIKPYTSIEIDFISKVSTRHVDFLFLILIVLYISN